MVLNVSQRFYAKLRLCYRCQFLRHFSAEFSEQDKIFCKRSVHSQSSQWTHNTTQAISFQASVIATIRHERWRCRFLDLPESEDVSLRVKCVDGGHRSVCYWANCPQYLRSQVADCTARQIEW